MVLFSIDLGSYGALIATPKEENHPGWLKYFRDNYTMEETGEFFTHSVTLNNGETKEYTFWRDLENRHYPIDEKLLEFLSVTE